MSTILQSRIPQLQREMEIITANGWDPMFCVAKLSAVAADDAEGYCEALEDELAVKGERLAELIRTESLSAEIVERLRGRIQADQEVIEMLRVERDTLFAEFKKLEVAEANDRDTDRLIANLEAENVRQTRRAESAEQKLLVAEARYTHAAEAAAAAQDLAHRLQQELEREKQRMKDMIAYMSAAQDEANTLRRATWAPLRTETEV
jgi:chromosome segregation ATPase